MAEQKEGDVYTAGWDVDDDREDTPTDIEVSEAEGFDCSPNWADRCRNARPGSKCGCACGGVNHGANRPQDR